MENSNDGGAETPADFGANIRPKILPIFYKTSRFFGPGTYSLLSLVRKTGSLRTASAEMGMSYSKSLLIIKNAEEQLGYPLVKKSRGGAAGGSTSLTENGERLLELYGAFSQEMQRLSVEVFERCLQAVRQGDLDALLSERISSPEDS